MSQDPRIEAAARSLWDDHRVSRDPDWDDIVASGERYADDVGQMRDMATDALAAADKAAPLHPAVSYFINERPQYVTAARSHRGQDNNADYYRWQGHMEARRQLAEGLGYTTPYEPTDRTERITR